MSEQQEQVDLGALVEKLVEEIEEMGVLAYKVLQEGGTIAKFDAVWLHPFLLNLLAGIRALQTRAERAEARVGELEIELQQYRDVHGCITQEKIEPYQQSSNIVQGRLSEWGKVEPANLQAHEEGQDELDQVAETARRQAWDEAEGQE